MTENPQFTDEQVAKLVKLADSADKVISVADDYDHAQWVGRLAWKLAVAIGAMVAGVAAFKGQLISLFKG